ncbi:MAG: hypothetical protein GDA46_07240 [Bdellovibrionales bacterium]|nr:hypothetical protein [Bdellovibrionales bacterium]
MEEAISYFAKLSEDESLQDLAYDEFRRKMDYRLEKQDWIEEGIEQGRQAEKKE